MSNGRGGHQVTYVFNPPRGAGPLLPQNVKIVLPSHQATPSSPSTAFTTTSDHHSLPHQPVAKYPPPPRGFHPQGMPLTLVGNNPLHLISATHQSFQQTFPPPAVYAAHAGPVSSTGSFAAVTTAHHDYESPNAPQPFEAGRRREEPRRGEPPTPDVPDNPIDLHIRNVVVTFSVRCHLDLQFLTLNTVNAVYERSKGCVMKQMRKPKCFAKIWSSGKIVLTGCRGEEEGRRAAKGLARVLQRLFPRVSFCSYRVANILATCKMPFGIHIEKMAENYPRESSYEPELHTGLIWRMESPKATLRIHSNGSITVTGATSVENVVLCLEMVHKLVQQFASAAPPLTAAAKRKLAASAAASARSSRRRGPVAKRSRRDDDDPDYEDDEYESDFIDDTGVSDDLGSEQEGQVDEDLSSEDEFLDV